VSSRRRGAWSSFEVARLRELFARGGVAHAAVLLRRTEAAVRRKVHELYDRRLVRGGWRPEEVEALRTAWGALDLEEVQLLLARSPRDIGAKVKELREQVRDGPWTPDELQRLKQLFGSRGLADLEVCLSRAADDIASRAEALCLGRDRKRRIGASRMPRWRPEEVVLLRRLYPHLENGDVARQMGRTAASVANKAHQLGLRKSPDLLARLGRNNVAHRHGRRRPSGAMPTDVELHDEPLGETGSGRPESPPPPKLSK